MRKSVLLLLAAAFGLLLVTTGAAFAQDGGTMDTVFCGDLSADDCALLEQAESAGMNVTAAAFDLFVDVQVTDDTETTPISLVGSGSYSGSLHMGDMMAADSDMMANMEGALTALRDFNGALMLTFTVPPEMMGGSDMPETITLDLRLVDGVGYINFDSLQAIIDDPSLAGWGGLDIAGLLGAVMDQHPEFLSQLGSMGGMMTGGVDPMLLAQLSDPARMGQYARITRTDDGTGATATFETTFDLAGFMADPAMQDMMRGQMNDRAGAMGQGMSEAQLEQMGTMMQQMFQNSRFVVRQQIDTTSGLTSSLSVESDLGMMGGAMMGAATQEAGGAGNGGMMMGNNNVSVTAMINYNYDAVPVITAPENAQILPYEQLLGMVSGMMGGANMTPLPMMPTNTPGAGDPLVTPEATAVG